jgi:hypothetical protein
MPYRYAHWYLLALFPLAGLAFWPGYVSRIATAPAQFHIHGITATLWLMLLVAQSWTMQRGQRGLHRRFGLLSLVFFPMFLAGGVGIFLGMAQRYVEGSSPFYTLYAPRLAWIDIVSVAAFALFFHEALRHRRRVHLHAGYLLATAILLLPPVLGRLAPLLPGLGISGPADFWKLGIGFQLANLVSAALAFAIAVRRGRDGGPFALAGAAVLLAAMLFQTIGGMAAWQGLFATMAGLPFAPLAISAGLAGVAVAASGWFAGRSLPRPPQTRPA